MRKRFTTSLLAVLCFALFAPMSAFADLRINEMNFPDPNFRGYLLEMHGDEDEVITYDVIARITEINVRDMNIYTLEGIQYFMSLEYLNCPFNQLTSLDVSKNTALTELECGDNQLDSLDVSKNTALTYLGCSVNQLTNLDISKNTALTGLGCGYNQLTRLNVSNNTALTALSCHGNQLTNLSLSKNTALQSLWCFSNQLTRLDVSNNTALTELQCHNNHLTSLDVSNNTALYYLYCDNNQLTSLDVSNNTALYYLYCNNNQLTSLDVSNNTRLHTLRCHNNNIKGADMDDLIGSLPNRPDSIYSLPGVIYIYSSISETEGNVCTKAQVAALKEKRWTPYYFDGKIWKEYEGSDDADGIIATEADNSSEVDANAPAYDLNGRRVEGWQSKKGVYIVGGKKVVVK